MASERDEPAGAAAKVEEAKRLAVDSQELLDRSGHPTNETVA